VDIQDIVTDVTVDWVLPPPPLFPAPAPPQPENSKAPVRQASTTGTKAIVAKRGRKYSLAQRGILISSMLVNPDHGSGSWVGLSKQIALVKRPPMPETLCFLVPVRHGRLYCGKWFNVSEGDYS